MRLDDSVTGALLSEGWRRGRVARSSSTVTQWVQDVGREVGTFARHSRLATTAGWTERAVRASWLYRWLTAEPEPDVVVIDLRETVVVGPVLSLLDRLLGPLVRHGTRARVGTVLTRLSERFAAHPVAGASTVALAAVLATLLVLVGLGTPSPSAVGIRLVALSLALAGTRIRVSGDELRNAYAYELLVALLAPPEPPDNHERDDERE
jgi:hypothetical protein